MRHQQAFAPAKAVHFGEPCESGYSTTTSSEEGTLQRGFTQARHARIETESFMKNPKFLQMISKGAAVDNVHNKNPHFHQVTQSKRLDREESPCSSTSSLTQQYYPPSSSVQETPTAFHDMASSYENLKVEDTDPHKAAAIREFQQTMDKVKRHQPTKFARSPVGLDYYRVGEGSPYYDPLYLDDVSPTSRKCDIMSSPLSSPVKLHTNGILKKHSPNPSSRASTHSHVCSHREDNVILTPPTSLSPISPSNRKSAFVIVKPRVHSRSVDAQQIPANQQSLDCFERSHIQHDNQSRPCFPELSNQTLQHQMTPRQNVQMKPPSTINYQSITTQLNISQRPNAEGLGSGTIVYIPAQIDKNGIARPINGDFHDKPKLVCHDNTKQANCDQGEPGMVSNSGHEDDKLRNENVKSPQSQAETLSNEAVRLRHFLSSANSEDLKKRLENLLKSKDPKSIQALSQLFPGSEFTAEAAHCVRCHKDFNPREPGRCILPHPERMVAKIFQDSMGADFVCGCCNEGFRLIKMDFYEESTNALLTGHCYSGTHTTDPESVDYRIHGGAAKMCEEFGCVEFYV